MIGIYKWGWGDGSENLAFWGWADYLELGAFAPAIVTGASRSRTAVSAWAPVAVTDNVIGRLSADGFKARISPQGVSARTAISDMRIKSVRWTAVYACDPAGFAHCSMIRGEIPGKIEGRNGVVKISGRADKAKAVKS